MAILQFIAPPLPHYIIGGYMETEPGWKHLNRRNIGIFDLIVVLDGCIYVKEDDNEYEVPAGHALILRPDCHHYGIKGSEGRTKSYWVHFQAAGKWGAVDQAENKDDEPDHLQGKRAFTVQTFKMLLPQFIRLSQPAIVYDKLRQLVSLENGSQSSNARWKQQLIFQQIIELLNASFDMHTVLPAASVAEQAATYLRKHYNEDVSIKLMSEKLNFHPVYIARCMQKELGCSPVEYLNRYRLEQAKLFLLQTDLPVSHIAQQVGFQQSAYFSTTFTRYEGISPREYRKRFRIVP
ncbi:AraC family transcriptional regulator [Paenibacillus protaetiae]|uniref:AraC family transcriptional regulator n=1 Tax=Paenibacillus protaetiae TaxID=2509456 RepID=A0A4P6EZG1_9BACL|nr:AraC family transcriptional regulator [Paenibacillus protaetiae]QAY68165.1 AraC family transcriptional regulator [Paenibacillus protaetiae]